MHEDTCADYAAGMLESHHDEELESGKDSRSRIGDFLLKLQCRHGLSRAATSGVGGAADELGQIIEQAVQESTASDKPVCTAQEACQELTSDYKLVKHCHDKVEYVPPTTVNLSTGIGEAPANYQYVDLTTQLQQLIKSGKLPACQHDKTIKLILYFDEFGTCNPLRKKSGDYSLGAVYFTVDNDRVDHYSQ